ncbi:MAG: hypothetical protein R3F61_09450 [Myxococcota bacterium]
MFLTLFALLGCPGEEPLDETLSGCDPLDPSGCLFPYPSDYHLVDDPGTPTGRRVDYGPTALPVNLDDVQLDPTYWNEKDGYSINSNMLFFFEDGSIEGLHTWDAVGEYASADAKTVIVDLSTGERVPHWTELDASADDPAEAVYVMRLAIPLEFDHHYAVGVRGLVKASGGPVDVSPAFRALRDGEETTDWDVEHRRERFDADVFPALEAAGFPRGELQLAWDFHTMSQENSLGRMVWMRDDALSDLPAAGPAYEVASVEDGDCTAEGATIGRTVELRVEAPLYTEIDDAGTLLTRDADGMPFRNGTTQFDVLVRIPCSVIENPGPSRVLQYGHGLLGSRYEARTGWLSRLADENGWIVVSTDWTGMSEDDVGEIVIMSAGDPSRFAIIPERGMQGMVQQLLVVPLMRGALMDDPALQVGGTTLIDPSLVSYYGNSQGAIMGAAFMALTKEIPRGVLGVTGVNYGLLLTRSHDFDIYFLIFKQKFDDDRDIALLIQGLVQQVWDPAEGAGYLWAVNRDPLPDTPPKDILLHTAIGDGQVTTIGGQIQARAYGAKLVSPAYRDVWGVEEAPSGFSGSALVEWHYSDAALEEPDNTPPEGPDPHECPRREPASYEQVRDFLVDGVVTHHCNGVCTSTVAEVCPP